MHLRFTVNTTVLVRTSITFLLVALSLVLLAAACGGGSPTVVVAPTQAPVATTAPLPVATSIPVTATTATPEPTARPTVEPAATTAPTLEPTATDDGGNTSTTSITLGLLGQQLQVGEGTVSNGNYSLTVSPFRGQNFTGKTIHFRVGGVAVSATGTWTQDFGLLPLNR